MGEVFRAHDSVLDRHVALKVIAADDADRRERFRREAQSAARLTHVRVEHFAPVEECLLSTVRTLTGDDFNMDVQLAWTRIYNFVAQTMIEATLTEG